MNVLGSYSQPSLPLWTQLIIIIIQVGVLFSLFTEPEVDWLFLSALISRAVLSTARGKALPWLQYTIKKMSCFPHTARGLQHNKLLLFTTLRWLFSLCWDEPRDSEPAATNHTFNYSALLLSIQIFSPLTRNKNSSKIITAEKFLLGNETREGESYQNRCNSGYFTFI